MLLASFSVPPAIAYYPPDLWFVFLNLHCFIFSDNHFRWVKRFLDQLLQMFWGDVINNFFWRNTIVMPAISTASCSCVVCLGIFASSPAFFGCLSIFSRCVLLHSLSRTIHCVSKHFIWGSIGYVFPNLWTPLYSHILAQTCPHTPVLPRATFGSINYLSPVEFGSHMHPAFSQICRMVA